MFKNVTLVINNNVQQIRLYDSEDIYDVIIRVYSLDENSDFEYDDIQFLSINNVKFDPDNFAFNDIVDNCTIYIHLKRKVNISTSNVMNGVHPQEYSEVSYFMELEQWRPLINQMNVCGRNNSIDVTYLDVEQFRGVIRKGKLSGRYGPALNFVVGNNDNTGNFYYNTIAINVVRESYDQTPITADQVNGSAIFDGTLDLDGVISSDRFTLYWLKRNYPSINIPFGDNIEYPNLHYIVGCGVNEVGKYHIRGIEHNHQIAFFKVYY